MTNKTNTLGLTLFFTRIMVFIVMLVNTLDKFVRPVRTAKIFENYYGIRGLGDIDMFVIGICEFLLLIAFLVGFKKKIAYAAVFVVHCIATISYFAHYGTPFEDINILYFAALPMVAACFTLFLLRDQDTILSLK